MYFLEYASINIISISSVYKGKRGPIRNSQAPNPVKRKGSTV